MKEIEIVIAQSNFLVGDVPGNLAHMIQIIDKIRDNRRAQVVVFPELALCGYPPEDLIMRRDFLQQVASALEKLAKLHRDLVLVVGYVEGSGAEIYNSAAVLHGGEKIANYRKQHLPNYRLFDEKRYFTAGEGAVVFGFQNVQFALTICEDIWSPQPSQDAKAAGADLIITLNASPFHAEKNLLRESEVKKRVAETGLPIVYCNLVGAQDEFVFDGASFAVDGKGAVVGRAPLCEATELRLLFSQQQKLSAVSGAVASWPGRLQSIYQILVLAVRDYVLKNGFPGVVIGLSGGVDSALTLAIAVDALGAKRVTAVSMPSRYTADMSVEDARLEAESLGVRFEVIAIEKIYKSYLESLKSLFANTPVDTTEQNLQARCRGNLLMAIANKQGTMVLTTSNKSEMAVGYATLYGDMAGGYAVLRDVPKKLVYELSHYRNQVGQVIPNRVLDRPPSAELAPDQKDADTLPDYDVLDDIVSRYVEGDESYDDIVAAGHSPELVERILLLINRNEYKRFQAPPGPRISRRAFGRDRRFPLTSGFSSRAKI